MDLKVISAVKFCGFEAKSPGLEGLWSRPFVRQPLITGKAPSPPGGDRLLSAAGSALWRDKEDVVSQTESLKAAFITYLQAKQAAGTHQCSQRLQSRSAQHPALAEHACGGGGCG